MEEFVLETFDMKSTLLFHQLGKHNHMVLSTSLNDKVTSRMMSVVIADKLFYFQTDRNFRKYEQLKKNPNVSLCLENIQIEGVCKEIGHPLDYPFFCHLFKECYPGSYEKYSSLPDEIVFEIRPLYIQKWSYVDGEPYIESYDFYNKKYNNIHYQ